MLIKRKMQEEESVPPKLSKMEDKEPEDKGKSVSQSGDKIVASFISGTGSQTASLKSPTKATASTSSIATLPTRQYLDQTIVPVMLRALASLTRIRPADPLGFIANFLLNERDRVAAEEQHSSGSHLE